MGFIRRFIIVILLTLFLVFPGGPIALAVGCHGQPGIDAIDWLLSFIVPGYGLVQSFICK